MNNINLSKCFNYINDNICIKIISNITEINMEYFNGNLKCNDNKIIMNIMNFIKCNYIIHQTNINWTLKGVALVNDTAMTAPIGAGLSW